MFPAMMAVEKRSAFGLRLNVRDADVFHTSGAVKEKVRLAVPVRIRGWNRLGTADDRRGRP
jgi:hypothetical protein